MMKIVLLILIATFCTLASSEYPRNQDHARFKGRGPQYPPRHPPMPSYMKKWQQPPPYQKRMPPPNRPSRPIPLHMPPKVPQQQMVAQSQHRPTVVAPPMRNFYKNPQPPPTVKFPSMIPEKQHYIQKENPQFLSSPSIAVAQEYDYHLQSNSIPTHTTPIKQVGEKGPIHTIPAPNLSLKDKPIVVEEIRKQQEFRYQQNQNQQPQNIHQYQVTESNEPIPKAAKIFGTQNIEIQPQQLYYVTEQNIQQPQSLPLQSQPSEISFRVVGNVPNVQTQAIQSTFVQQQPQVNYQLLNQQLFQAEPVYVQNQDKVSVEPEYQSFNYDEQAHQKQQALMSKSDISSLVTAAYNLEEQKISSRSSTSVDPLTQTQIVQSYFDTRPDEDENIVEADARPSEKQQHHEEEKVLESAQRFSSLPNKEAAERLAQLQAAGKINSHLMKIPPKQIIEGKNPLTIFVPEDEEGSREDQSLEYSDDYVQEEEVRSSEEETFGQRVQNNN